MKKRDTKKVEEEKKVFTFGLVGVLLFVFLFFFVLILHGSAMTYKDGIHNVDLGLNMRFLEERFNLNLIDYGSDDVYRDGGELAHLGYKQIDKGYRMGIFSGIFFGYTFAVILILFFYMYFKLKEYENKYGE